MGHNILIIKLGALGDFVQAFGPFQAIRAHHPGARITLLTTRPYEALARAMPWVDEVWVDSRPKMWNLPGVLSLALRLRSRRWDMVYDLQTSDRSGFYYRLMRKGTKWSGIARGCSHPHFNPDRDAMHTIDRQAEQLAMAGIPSVPPPDLSWADTDLSHVHLPEKFALLVPGGAPHRPAKRWPAVHFAALAGWIGLNGTVPMILGTEKEREQIDAILDGCPKAVSLAGKTSFLDMLALGRKAEFAVGNDTGPMHLLAASGCPCAVLFSEESDPALCAPRGHVVIAREDNLADLDVEQAVEAVLHAVKHKSVEKVG